MVGLTGNYNRLGSSSNPADVIRESQRNSLAGPPLQYPSELPPIHINILETSWKPKNALSAATTARAQNALSQPATPPGVGPTTGSFAGSVGAVAQGAAESLSGVTNIGAQTLGNHGNLDASKGKLYRLPLPLQLQENYEVNYGEHAFGASLANINQNIQPGLSVGAGMIINEMKNITLEQPFFKRHQFQWKLSPKSFAESQNIQRIVWNLKKGMSAKRLQYNGTTLPLLGFPNIYVLFFMPNTKFLFKFKPCVLQNISIDFYGGNPAPAFFGSESAESKAPESLMVTTTWLEIEYWLDGDSHSDFKTGDDGLGTNEIKDGWSYYKFKDSNSNLTGQGPQ